MSTLVSRNPATGEVVGEVAITAPERIPGLVARARDAQRRWGSTPIEERVASIGRAGALLADRAAEVGRLLTREMGKPLAEAVGEVRHTAAQYAGDLEGIRAALAPEVIESADVRTTVVRDPFGVAACIAPWNFPVLMPYQQVVPALAAGNSVLLKPSEETPLVTQAFADTLLEVLPEGVLTVVHGADTQGKALVAADVDLIVFTGSREAGKHILGEASKGLKRVILELGGKDPLLVLEDADVDAAAAFAARNAFRNAGQVCVSTERIYVDRAVRERFVAGLVDHAGRMRVGDGLADGTAVGPMISARQRARVEAQIDAATAAGARVAWRGEAPEGEAFLAPVVLIDVTDEMAITREETFGPVACVYDVSGADEAVERANDSPFGLGAVVFGGSERARDVARRLTSGMVGINQGLASAGDTPWVGARQSGYGFHSGRDGHRQFAQTRVLNEPRAR